MLFLTLCFTLIQLINSYFLGVCWAANPSLEFQSSNASSSNSSASKSLGLKPSSTKPSTTPMASKQVTVQPLEATISTTNFLPPAMYGQWSVMATLIESNTPNFFTPQVTEIWVLEQSGNSVTISNPANGASATINIDKVKGNTATFHRMQYSRPERRILESPTVTVDGDLMVGTTLNALEVVKNGKVVQGFYSKYSLKAERLGGARVKFGQSNFGSPEPDEFVIEKVRHSDDPSDQ
ncbi:MAG: hypothetical protein K2X66_01330 [Cyanobacteria bacterium]|nr:hypothetical protein [Cyanobacteriota bacterium]